MSNKFYVIRSGKKPGVYDSRDETKRLVEGFAGAKYKWFKTEAEAKQAYQQWPEQFYQNKPKERRKTENLPFEKNSIAVDAACSGNPGKLEYKWIDLVTGASIFHKSFPIGTNNIGEFLALVHGLMYLKKNNSDKAIYSDSRIAINRIAHKKCPTKLQKNSETEKILEIVHKAIDWLKNNNYTTKILKRETEERGEIPADFNRK